MRRAFLEADGRHDMPDLVNLLKKARSYKGTGMAAELFYEGVISEVVAFVMQHSSFCPKEHRSIPLTREDREAIDFICGYIASNLGGGPVLLSPGKPALHREDKVEKPLQNGNGTVAIPLRRARAHGRGRSPACRNRFGDSGNRRKSRLYQAGCIYGGLPKDRGCTPAQFRKQR